MEAQADSLLSPITTAADRSDSTTMLVSEGSDLPQILHQAFIWNPQADHLDRQDLAKQYRHVLNVTCTVTDMFTPVQKLLNLNGLQLS